jgi:transposase
MKGFYGGIDLHAKNAQACAINREGVAVKEKKFGNDLVQAIEFFKPYYPDIEIAIESTVNWYWLVDGLMDAGFDVKLAHPLGLKAITDAKVKTDRRDAYKLANLLRLNALPKAYVYPKEIRPFRDLLRRRSDLVIQRAKCYSSLRMQFLQYNTNTMSQSALKRFEDEDLNIMNLPEVVKMHGSMTLKRIKVLGRQIDEIEQFLESVTIVDPRFELLTKITGIGRVLALTIYYEIGDISRFKNVRHFSSYCRLVPGIHQSSDKVKRGKGSKQGNVYLKWAFTQAAIHMLTYDKDIRAYRDRRAAKNGGKNMKANAVLAHKLGMAVFYVLREGKAFKKELLFA